MDNPESNPDPGGQPPPPPPPEGFPPAGQPVPETPPAAGVAKADIGKRIVAAIIDGVVAGVLMFIPWFGWLLAAAYWLLRDGLEIEFMHRRSLGKKLMKLRPVRLDGMAVDIETSVKRNWMLALVALSRIPLLGWFLLPVLFVVFIIYVVEFVLVISDAAGRRWGDKLAATQVVESAD